MPAAAGALIGALAGSHIFTLVKITEVIAGGSGLAGKALSLRVISLCIRSTASKSNAPSRAMVQGSLLCVQAFEISIREHCRCQRSRLRDPPRENNPSEAKIFYTKFLISVQLWQ